MKRLTKRFFTISAFSIFAAHRKLTHEKKSLTSCSKQQISSNQVKKLEKSGRQSLHFFSSYPTKKHSLHSIKVQRSSMFLTSEKLHSEKNGQQVCSVHGE